MIHIYCGDGKGKTTASCGLAVRAAGNGMKVLFAQFFKSGASGEIKAIKKLGSAVVTMHQDVHCGRYKTLNDEQKELEEASCKRLAATLYEVSGNYDLLVLDEIISVYNYGLINKDSLIAFLQKEGCEREIVLTGRAPAPELLELADYVTEMKKLKHPFDKSIPARKGVEF